MSDQDAGPPADERRSRAGLRLLIEEMMMQLRTAAHHDTWTVEERARAEADLARIMAQVRDAALYRGRSDA
ncbi:MAG TPA: hypothetical protein VFS08_09335 [Gemmatimonadaceae bacterium]|nr:hypothetical protein [Gemmatimonadaceae bacterium]